MRRRKVLKLWYDVCPPVDRDTRHRLYLALDTKYGFCAVFFISNGGHWYLVYIEIMRRRSEESKVFRNRGIVDSYMVRPYLQKEINDALMEFPDKYFRFVNVDRDTVSGEFSVIVDPQDCGLSSEGFHIEDFLFQLEEYASCGSYRVKEIPMYQTGLRAMYKLTGLQTAGMFRMEQEQRGMGGFRARDFYDVRPIYSQQFVRTKC